MSRTIRVRMMSQALHAALTRPHAVMAIDIEALHATAATISAGTALTTAQTSVVTAAQRALGGTGKLQIRPRLTAAQRTQLSASVASLADAVAIGQRTEITTAVTAALEGQGWTVTVVHGGDPDRYTGIEATRDTEHFVAGAAAGELIADQAGAHDCDATVEAITASLSKIGMATITQDVPHGPAGGTLYALAGGPTRAHAVQASLRRDTPWAKSRQRQRTTPAAIRHVAGEQ